MTDSKVPRANKRDATSRPLTKRYMVLVPLGKDTVPRSTRKRQRRERTYTWMPA